MNMMHDPARAEMMLDPVMQLRGITKRYGPVTALDNVSISLVPGEIHAIVGENGAGKSTLINIASGVVRPNGGEIVFAGRVITDTSSAAMRRLGVAVVHQHPALAPDLTVRENIALGLDAGMPGHAAVTAALADIANGGMGIHPDDRLSQLTIAQWHIVEIAKALLLKPKVLILDEPTEPFGKSEVERLFSLLRSCAAQGVAIIYISHRLREVLDIADVVTVIRDGNHVGTMPRANVREDEIIAMIAGRTMDRLFPEKTPCAGPTVLAVENLEGAGFANVSMDLPSGMIIGLAGIEGQGQRAFIRALAGLQPATGGAITCEGRIVPSGDRSQALSRGIGFITDDRHAEGLFKTLSLAENLTVPVLGQIVRNGLISPARETTLAGDMLGRFAVKTAGLDATPSQLSGGNQQKLLLSRELAARPKVLLVDEPTKGVDVGARFEIYKALRSLAADGTAVLVLCSDALELQGLCDRVHVFSGGGVVATFDGDAVSETQIAAAMISGGESNDDTHQTVQSTRLSRFLKGDLAPILPVGAVTLAIMGFAAFVNPYYLTEYNLMGLASLLAILIFVAIGQAAVFSIGGIDLSSGPLAGLMVVLASFLIANDGGGSVTLGILGCLAVAVIVGLFHAATILLLRLPPIVVTLATYVAIGGVSLLLRPEPAGTINYDYMDQVAAPVVFLPLGLVVALGATALLALSLGYTRLGRKMRAFGSDPSAASRLGVGASSVTFAAYGLSALCSGAAGLLLAAQIGTGSATTGTEYTLMGITAFVISGASISGGRLSLLSVLVAALLVQVTLNVTTFLNIDTAWQQWLIGAAVIAGAAVFSQLRGASRNHG
ncbi:ATP-binding cassette domain-containing protein [uncultured Hoeflea sp.]|uniref:ATP-binding cassette domain-containing protein n=1 Tax=uncultured Hoeflea sp. TaxID=538666 RepID=UPI0030DCBEF7